MLNFGAKKEAMARYNGAKARLESIQSDLSRKADELFALRKEANHRVVRAVQSYVNSLANSPKEFKEEVASFSKEFDRFSDHSHLLQKKQKALEVQGSLAGAGALAGLGVAALGPSAAMTIATTFGTASTGTAIASLSGAAAQSAALAWLGGGTLAAGGGGAAGGAMVLAAMGPVGIAAAGVMLGGGAVLASKKNNEIAEHADAYARALETQINRSRVLLKTVEEIRKLTLHHTDESEKHLKLLKQRAPQNYHEFDIECKQELAALINNIRSLTKLLRKNSI